MNRREVLRYTAWFTGTAVSASLASAILSGCSKQSSESTQSDKTVVAANIGHLHFFTPEQFAQVSVLADVILPRTDSPSATDVNVHVTIDSMLGQVFNAEYQTSFKNNWIALEKHLAQQKFSTLDAAAQLAVLKSLELNQDEKMASAKRGLIEFKQQVIAYYLSTEEIGEKYLNYLPVPGYYKPCISVDEVNNKAWAL